MEVRDSLEKTGKEVIELTFDQVLHFAGNMLQVEGHPGKRILVMSQQAYDSLTREQIDKINSYNPILAVPIPTIEKYGGGSVRCMMAEVFLPKR